MLVVLRNGRMDLLRNKTVDMWQWLASPLYYISFNLQKPWKGADNKNKVDSFQIRKVIPKLPQNYPIPTTMVLKTIKLSLFCVFPLKDLASWY